MEWFTDMIPKTFPGSERIHRAVCLTHTAPPCIYFQGFILILSWSDIINKWSDFASPWSLKCITLCRWMCVGVFKLSHISLHNLSQQKCMFTTNIIKPGGCMIACGLIILFVALPTDCLPADHNAGLFMKWNCRELLWTACNYTAPQNSPMWAMQNPHDSNKTPFD